MPSNNTQGEYNYTIPQTVGEVEVVIHGAKGGHGGSGGGYIDGGSNGEEGGYIKGKYNVSENSTQSLVIAVGGEGGDGGAKNKCEYNYGYWRCPNNGGSGGSSPLNSGSGGGSGGRYSPNVYGEEWVAGGGGGGGGESGIKINNSLIATAGGGGGGGGSGTFGTDNTSGSGGDGGAGGGRNNTGGSGGSGGNPESQNPLNSKSGTTGDVTSISSLNVLDEQKGGSNYNTGYVEVNYAPEAPTSINVSATGRDISINWSNAKNQNGYKLFRNGNKVYQANSTSYSESVTPGNSYTYTVSAYNEYGESQYNTSDSVTIEPAIVNRIEDNNNDYPRVISAKKWDGSNWTDTKTYQSNGNDWYR